MGARRGNPSTSLKAPKLRTIARELEEQHGLKMAPNTITRWFERGAAKRWRVPMGFEEATPKRELPGASGSFLVGQRHVLG